MKRRGTAEEEEREPPAKVPRPEDPAAADAGEEDDDPPAGLGWAVDTEPATASASLWFEDRGEQAGAGEDENPDFEVAFDMTGGRQDGRGSSPERREHEQRSGRAEQNAPQPAGQAAWLIVGWLVSWLVGCPPRVD